MASPRSVDTDDQQQASVHRLAVPSTGFDSRDAIEGCLDRLNRSSPLARRDTVSVNSQFVEFALPKNNLLRLGAELSPGGLVGTPNFAPVLRGATAQRLLLMARQTRELAQRWGFQSAGKFSQAYVRRFGERPRDGRALR